MATNSLSWTDEVYQIWGRKKEEFPLSFENFTQTIHPKDLDEFLEEQEKSVAGIQNHDVVH